MKICGIYKITSPTGKIYIGQSVNIVRRFKTYRSSISRSINQTKLYNSFKKHGIQNHTFEIQEECSIDMLNERERYWQEYYDVIGENGMNCRLTESDDYKGRFSVDSKIKMRKSAKKRILTKEEIEKRTEYLVKSNIKRKGIPKSKEQRDKISKTLTGRKNYFFRDFNHPNSVIVLDTETGVYYGSIADCARSINKRSGWLVMKLRERNRCVNNTKFIIV